MTASFVAEVLGTPLLLLFFRGDGFLKLCLGQKWRKFWPFGQKFWQNGHVRTRKDPYGCVKTRKDAQGRVKLLHFVNLTEFSSNWWNSKNLMELSTIWLTCQNFDWIVNNWTVLSRIPQKTSVKFWNEHILKSVWIQSTWLHFEIVFRINLKSFKLVSID